MNRMMVWTAAAVMAVCAVPMGAMAAEEVKPSAELSGTALLNKQQQEKAARDNAAYEARMAAAKQNVDSSEAEFQARTQAYEAEKQRVAEQAANERLKWEADVKACEGGDKSRCAAVAVPQ